MAAPHRLTIDPPVPIGQLLGVSLEDQIAASGGVRYLREGPARVNIESPYSGDIPRNVEYARRCMQDSLKRGEAPFVSHLLYTQHPTMDFVADDDPNVVCVGRDGAMRAAQEWYRVAHKDVVYTDYGISPGMQAGIAYAMSIALPVEYRNIGPNPPYEPKGHIDLSHIDDPPTLTIRDHATGAPVAIDPSMHDALCGAFFSAAMRQAFHIPGDDSDSD